MPSVDPLDPEFVDRKPVEISVPRETAPERAIRLQSMLDSGRANSRAELARMLGVTRSAITQALKHLPSA